MLMFSYYMMIVIDFLIILMNYLMIFVSIAYVTLLERKVLGYVQNRKGPNKVGLIGIFQPFSEVIKLFSKEVVMIIKSSYLIFYLSPIFSMVMLLMVWVFYPLEFNVFTMSNYSIMIILLILSLNSYVIMLMGWSSSSLFAMIGSIRSLAQILSYEVSFIMIILVQMILSESYSFIDFLKWQHYSWFMWMIFPLMIVFLISILAELNRSPMDLIEGESELVSGFNVEYFSGSFALIFLVEYGMIIFMSLMCVYMYMGSNFNLIKFILMFMFITLIIMIRGILPRMRYDELMYLCWKVILPLILNYLIILMMLKLIMNFDLIMNMK